MSEVDDNNITGRSLQHPDAELQRLVRINRSDYLTMIVSLAFFYLQGRDHDRICHLPEGRTIPPYKAAVKDRVSKETRVCSILKNATVESPVELHHRTQGGVSHEPH
jgi:hypothetical protein